MAKPLIVILTGAGMSEESGLSTFRGADGLWEGHDIVEVASPEGWQANPQLVNTFYNARRKQLFEVKPNDGHKALAQLENEFEVQIITQNVDDLHERAGSQNILHLHGELRKVRNQRGDGIRPWDNDLDLSNLGEDGLPLRPHIVWFGEDVPAIPTAIEWTRKADYFVVIGTSLQVYPAANLIYYTASHTEHILIDPYPPQHLTIPRLTVYPMKACEGIQEWINQLKQVK